MSPYIYVGVTVTSVFATYYFTHMNNLKVLREKWINEFRNTSCDLIEAYEKLYYANSSRYERLGNSQINVSDTERLQIIKSCEDAQAHATAALTKLQLLFKNGDSEYERLSEKIKNLHDCSDKPEKIGNELRMNPSTRREPQEKYLFLVNEIINKNWNDISKSPFLEVKDFLIRKVCSKR